MGERRTNMMQNGPGGAEKRCVPNDMMQCAYEEEERGDTNQMQNGGEGEEERRRNDHYAQNGKRADGPTNMMQNGKRADGPTNMMQNGKRAADETNMMQNGKRADGPTNMMQNGKREEAPVIAKRHPGAGWEESEREGRYAPGVMC